jgi:glycosyltransferase involved in cell wall biosynthesis
MRVLFIYKYLTHGGVETVLRSRLEQLPQSGVDAYAWFLGDHGGRNLFHKLEHRLYVGEGAIMKNQLQKFDIIVSIDTQEVIHLLPSSDSVIFECHSPYLENLEYLKSDEFQALEVCRVFTPSVYQSEIVHDFGIPANKVRVIPNSVGGHFFSPINVVPKYMHPLILWVGRLDALKNWTGFLSVIAELRKTTNNFEAIMVGKVSWRNGRSSHVFKKIQKGKLTDCVRWIESISFDRMCRLYDLVRESDGVVISTSKNESFGMTIAEAMSRGCTVLAPEKGPFIEFVHDRKNGYLYSEKTSKNIAARLAEIIREKNRFEKIGRTAIHDINHAFHPKVANETLRSELLNCHHRR